MSVGFRELINPIVKAIALQLPFLNICDKVESDLFSPIPLTSSDQWTSHPTIPTLSLSKSSPISPSPNTDTDGDGVGDRQELNTHRDPLRRENPSIQWKELADRVRAYDYPC
jgi:hypothetical protein